MSDIENAPFIDFARRIIAAAGRRVGAGDVAQLGNLLDLRHDLDQACIAAVTGLVADGYSWQDMASEAGLSKQALHARFASKIG